MKQPAERCGSLAWIRRSFRRPEIPIHEILIFILANFDSIPVSFEFFVENFPSILRFSGFQTSEGFE